MNSKWEEKNLEECIADGDVCWASVGAAVAVSLCWATAHARRRRACVGRWRARRACVGLDLRTPSAVVSSEFRSTVQEDEWARRQQMMPYRQSRPPYNYDLHDIKHYLSRITEISIQ